MEEVKALILLAIAAGLFYGAIRKPNHKKDKGHST